MPSCSVSVSDTVLLLCTHLMSSAALTFMEGIATLKKNVVICGDLCLYILFIITTIILLFFFFLLLTIMILHFESIQISIHSL